MDYFFSIWFKVGLVILAFLAVYGIVVFLVRNWIREQAVDFSDEKRLRLVQSVSRTIPVYKILFWMLPVYLLIIISVYLFDPEISYFLITGIAFVYVASFEGFLISKTLLKAIDNK